MITGWIGGVSGIAARPAFSITPGLSWSITSNTAFYVTSPSMFTLSAVQIVRSVLLRAITRGLLSAAVEPGTPPKPPTWISTTQVKIPPLQDPWSNHPFSILYNIFGWPADGNDHEKGGSAGFRCALYDVSSEIISPTHRVSS